MNNQFDDPGVYAAIVRDYCEFNAKKPQNDTLGGVFGRFESSLPFDKKLIERAFESILLMYHIRFIETGNRMVQRLMTQMEKIYLTLGEYIPDEEMAIKAVTAGNPLSKQMYVVPKEDVKRAMGIVVRNSEKYMDKVQEIRAWADVVAQNK